jgi:ribosomal protein L24E
MHMTQLHVCNFCQNTGKNGASFILVAGETETRVHKFCGEKLAVHAPAGVKTRLIHWAELRREKQEASRADEAAKVRSFWEEKFSEARARKQRHNGVAP